MADKIRITVRQFIEAALQFSQWKCEVCGSPLIQTWIGDDYEPDLHYVHCSNEACEKEYTLSISFVLDPDIPQGR